jgi:NADH-quinone oxidoreductase subunit E
MTAELTNTHGFDDTTIAELREIAARYPEKRSGLLPMLHLLQSVQGRVTPEGIEVCADLLELSAADVSGVATFYTMYKRRPVGDYHVGVCTNTLCAVMGGDEIFARLKDHLDVGNDETTDDGKITLEHVECNAACDYAPVVMVNWEFMDDQTPESAVQLVDDLRAGTEVRSTRGARLCTWREAERVLAGFPDGRADEGPGAGERSLLGLRIARERGWTAPDGSSHDSGTLGAGVPEEPEQKVAGAQESDDDVAEQAAVEEEAPTGEAAAEKEDAQ